MRRGRGRSRASRKPPERAMVFADSNSRRPPVAPERIVHDAAQALAPQARGASSSGVTNCSQRCVPGSSQRRTYSAPTMARAKLLKVQLTVATRTRGIRQERYTAGLQGCERSGERLATCKDRGGLFCPTTFARCAVTSPWSESRRSSARSDWRSRTTSYRPLTQNPRLPS
jgi:hypothetical protein